MRYNGRELTLKETSTASLKSQLASSMTKARSELAECGYISWSLSVEIDALEAELEERAEWESKVSRR